VDQLLQSRELQVQWREGRRLQMALEGTGKGGAKLPPGGWNRVRRASGLGRARVVRLSATATRALVFAASVVLVAGLAVTAFFGLPGGPAPTGEGTTRVELASERGRMSDDRFVELTAELLRADPKYHRRMLEVMEVVHEQAYGREGEPENDASFAAATGENGEAAPRRTSEGSGNPIEFNLW
jgi:hypothetical protein